MGLLNKRNLMKAKALADKNKDKIAATVTKATAAVDEKTGGKHAEKLKKLDDAAKKYAGFEAPTPDGEANGQTTDRSVTPSDLPPPPPPTS